MLRYCSLIAVLSAGILASSLEARAGAARTTHPVVLAHGLAGFDNLVGLDYWGDDYGTFVGDACDQFLEVTCNGDIDPGQKVYVTTVQPFHGSELRGLDLANDIEAIMATTGASQVNLVGHSQGGIDIRKAARVLYDRKGYTVVPVLISVSSPHRGSPVAKYVLDLGDGVTSVIDTLARIFGDLIYQPGNDGYAAAKQLVYNDYSASDGVITGMRAFNQAYNVDSRHATRYASVITAQEGLSVTALLYLVRGLFHNIDGDGYCLDDCDNDGAGGRGDGNAHEADDDGLVGINSQQMGHRLRYDEHFFSLDAVSTDPGCGFVGDLNAPGELQMRTTTSVINQDHMDVIGLGPDTFDEMEFYAALFDYIAYHD